MSLTVHLEKQIQLHCIYLHNTTDEVQLETPVYDPDIDGHIQQEETTTPKEVHSSSTSSPPEPDEQNSSSKPLELDEQNSYGPDHIPTSFPDTLTTTQSSLDTNTADPVETNQEIDQEEEELSLIHI